LLAGVAAATSDLRTILIAGSAAVAAGAFSMASGEYVSVAAQGDAEKADRAQEERELLRHPEGELAELTGIYVSRGVTPEVAAEVAKQLTAADALGAHLRDEIGIHDDRVARPVQAAVVSATSFVLGAAPTVLPVVIFSSTMARTISIWCVCLVLLAVLGTVGAQLAGAGRTRGTIRVLIGGALALLVTTVVGSVVGGF
jgi:VIT1/CCC1 family predicted Fe2+/Mn2+ transporter